MTLRGFAWTRPVLADLNLVGLQLSLPSKQIQKPEVYQLYLF